MMLAFDLITIKGIRKTPQWIQYTPFCYLVIRCLRMKSQCVGKGGFWPWKHSDVEVNDPCAEQRRRNASSEKLLSVVY